MDRELTRSRKKEIKQEFTIIMGLIKEGNEREVIAYLDSHNYTKDRCMELCVDSATLSHRMFLAVREAARLGHTEVMNAIISRGFHFEEKEEFEEQCHCDLKSRRLHDHPIHIACQGGHLDTVRSLVEQHGVNIDKMNIERDTPLLLVLHSGVENTFDIAQYLLSAGASVNKFAALDGQLPIHMAVNRCSTEVCQLLISHGANVNVYGQFQTTPLLSGISGGKLDKVSVLLDAGAKLNMCGWFGQEGPLDTVCSLGNLPMMELLLSHGADPEDKATNTGRTPLHTAAVKGQYDIARYLTVEVGVCLGTRDANEETAFMVAVGEGNTHIADMLVKCGYNPRAEEVMFEDEDLLVNMTGMTDLIEDWKKIISAPRTLYFQNQKNFIKTTIYICFVLPAYSPNNEA